MFESWYASRPTPESKALLDRVRNVSRREAQAAAERLVAIGELFVLRCRDSGERADWGTDTWEAVAAQVAAAMRTSVAMGSSYLRYAVAMRNRLPKVGQAFQAGDIDYRAFQTIVYRTDLIEDDDALAKVDAQLAVLLSRCPSVTRGRLAAAVDKVVANVDRDAVRRAAEAATDRRFVDVDIEGCGMAALTGSVLPTAGQAFDRRLDELARTVCHADPRTLEQRRADALGAMAAGGDRLVCGCGSADCAAAIAAHSNVVIHVVAEQSTVDGTGTNPGVLAGAEGLIPAELVAELAKSAKLRPLARPAEDPEPGYRPSTQLADFVRCRDLTCRAPGCDQPAVACDLDHTVAYGDGGRTQASNLKCLCRKHHLLKTFWGWRDMQLPDGTVIWLLPDGHTYVTTPGSALLFPNLCAPTGDAPAASPGPHRRSEDREVMMPRRSSTRAQNRAKRIIAERRHNRLATQAAEAQAEYVGAHDTPELPPDPHEPPPF
ncbi:HNH endonuclease signature motif containing protein [Mycobacterium kansasii]